MDDSKVFSSLLRTLAVSPLWAWDSPPILWAVLSEDEPVVVTPALILPDLETLHQVAEQWRSRMPDGTVPVDTLCLTCEGLANLPDGRVLDFRDAIVVHKDGAMSMFRHLRGTDDAVEYDPQQETLQAIDMMREVGAASWR